MAEQYKEFNKCSVPDEQSEEELHKAFIAGAEWYVDKMSHIHGAVEAIQKSWNRGDLWLTEFDQDILKQIGIKI